MRHLRQRLLYNAMLLCLAPLAHAGLGLDPAIEPCGGGGSSGACTDVEGLRETPDEATLLQIAKPAKVAVPARAWNASLVLARASRPVLRPMMYKRACDTIHASIESCRAKPQSALPCAGGPDCDTSRLPLPISSCTLTGINDCRLKNMPSSVSTAIFPDPNVWGTWCMNATSPYHFQVWPGDANKLLIYFEGGGVCFDDFTFSQDLCKKTAEPLQWASGIFNRGEPANPYKDFTIVLVTYCSGDLHVGQKKWTFNGMRVDHTGYKNSRVAINWALRNVNKKLALFTIMGTSAGSLAVRVWSRTLLTEFSTKPRSFGASRVIMDAHMDVLPLDEAPHWWGSMHSACSTPLGEGWSRGKCGIDLTRQDCLIETMQVFRSTLFMAVTSKADAVQRAFYSLSAPAPVSDVQWHTAMLGRLAELDQSPNFVSYLVDGQSHSFTDHGPCTTYVKSPWWMWWAPYKCTQLVKNCEGSMYDASPSGPLCNSQAGQRMSSWLGQLSGHLSNQCNGLRVPRTPGQPFQMHLCDVALSTKSAPAV